MAQRLSPELGFASPSSLGCASDGAAVRWRCSGDWRGGSWWSEGSGGDGTAVQMDSGTVQICEDDGGAKVETLLLRSGSRFLLP